MGQHVSHIYAHVQRVSFRATAFPLFPNKREFWVHLAERFLLLLYLLVLVVVALETGGHEDVVVEPELERVHDDGTEQHYQH